MPRANPLPDAVKEYFTYDPETGHVSGPEGGTGWVHSQGYRHVQMGKQVFKAHRVAWYLKTGSQPPLDIVIDHINHDRADNRWCNLRLATNAQNMAYRKMPERTLPRGVRKYYSRYTASIRINNRTKHIGCYDTPEEASAAFQQVFNQRVGAEWNILNLKAA